MHLIPEGASNVACLIGIDPGSTFIGVCLLDFNVVTLEVVRTQAWTVDGSRLGHLNEWVAQSHSDRFARIEAHKQEFKNLLQTVMPLAVVCESPFFNRLRPNAFEVLVEVKDMLRQACYEFHPDLPFFTIDPPTAKKAVHAKGNAKKDEMMTAVLQLPDIVQTFTGLVPVHLLSEHAIDAIAVAYSRLQDFRRHGV